MRSTLAAVILTSLIGLSAGYGKTPLRFDGLYYRPGEREPVDGKAATYYLRFYADGLVLAVVSTGTPQDLVLWFHRGHVPSFRYSLEGRALRFKESTEMGDIWYRGTVHPDFLDFDMNGRLSRSGRQIHLGKHRYRFIPLVIAP